MNEEQLTRLRNRLERKKQRLEASNGVFFLPKLRRFRAFLKSEPFLVPILDELRSNEKGKTAADKAAKTGERSALPTNPSTKDAKEAISSLSTDEEMAAMASHLLEGLAGNDEDCDKMMSFCWPTSSGNVKTYLTFKHEVIAPLCDYLADKLDDQQAILGLLIRYKHRCEWFNRRALLETAKEEDEKKRAEVEKVLKEDLYRHLHDQGMEFTIEPKSERGEIDLILDQTEGDRKYLEGKVFDNDRREAKYIIKGFGQLLHYLRQYNASNGYLLIYKTCEHQLVFDGAEQLGTVPFICCEGKTVFILVVDICEYQKPVSQRTYQPVRITADELSKADPTR